MIRWGFGCRSAGGPFPADSWLSSSTLVRLNVLALIKELVVGAVVVVKHVKVSRVEEITVLGVTEVNHSAFLRLPIRIGNLHTMVAEALLHPADTIQRHKALREGLGLVVPVLASIGIV